MTCCWLRYPADREQVPPACHTPELTDCTGKEIVNAYDHTIADTDHFLASLIDRLDARDRVVPALFHASDHGESLGQGGLYLHGAPDYPAPETQTRMPMVFWMSDRFRASLALDKGCLAAGTGEAVSHDNMFSTVLGLLDVATTARDAGLDLAGACRKMAS